MATCPSRRTPSLNQSRWTQIHWLLKLFSLLTIGPETHGKLWRHDPFSRYRGLRRSSLRTPPGRKRDHSTEDSTHFYRRNLTRLTVTVERKILTYRRCRMP